MDETYYVRYIVLLVNLLCRIKMGKYKAWCKVCDWIKYTTLKREADYEARYHKHVDCVVERIG